MKKSYTNSIMASAVAAALALPAVNANAAIAFFNGGVGPLISISGFATAAGNVMLQGIAGAQADVAGGQSAALDKFQLYGQTRIADFGAGVTPPAGFEYTLVMSVPLIQNFNGINFAATLDTTAGAANFFEIWYGASDADNQDGTGFRNGTNILTGTVTSLPNFGIIDATALLGAGLQLLDNRSGAGSTSFMVGGCTEVGASPPGSNDCTRSTFPADAGTTAPILTINTTGSFQVGVEVSSSNGSFFNGAPNFLTTAFAVNDTSPVQTPFNAVAPSHSYAALGAVAPDLGGVTRGGAYVATPLGLSPVGATNPLLVTQLTADGVGLAAQAALTVNSFRCTDGVVNAATQCDFVAQGQGAGVFSGTFVPEPGSLALLGLGLSGLGFFSRRRKTA